jgi:uncharacterized protein (TIGR02391 family)
MSRVRLFTSQQLEAIAKVIGDTETGLKGSEIGQILASAGIKDVSPDSTKWIRLYNAWVEDQNSARMGNCVIKVITRAMSPIRYTTNHELFRRRQTDLNQVLVMCGMRLGDDGHVRNHAAATTLTEAQTRASRLQSALESRGVHPDVLTYCRAELLQENYFHAVLEAMKSIAAKIRAMTDLPSDGAALAQEAFGLSSGPPRLAINALRTDSDKSEQRGFVSLLTGLFGTIRNPLAHTPKVEWSMSEQDAMDILTTASLIHRKLDKAYRP